VSAWIPLNAEVYKTPAEDRNPSSKEASVDLMLNN